MTAGPVVALDVSAVPPDPSGVGRYVTQLVAALDRRGRVELRLVARTGDGERWGELAPRADVQAVAPASRAPRLVWEQTLEPRLVERWGVDLHHGPHYTTPEAARVPKVVTIHDLTFFDHPEWHERVKVLVFRRAIRVAARICDALVCVSAATARRLEELYRPDCPVHVVPHGVDEEVFRPDGADDDEEVLGRMGVRRPYVAFVGTVEPRKDLATLIRAFERIAADHPGLRLALAGHPGWGAEALAEQVSASPFRDRIVRTGYVPDRAVPALLRGAEAVAYPSLEEGFGLPALEALACGAPLVTTAGSVMADVAGDAATLVPPGDVEALAAALAALVAGDPAQPGRRERGLAIAAGHSWEASAAAHEEVYRAVAASPRRHP